MTEQDIHAVREVLQKFQDGYDRRDAAVIDDFKSLFVPEMDLEVIGTGAVIPGDDEWCLGRDAVCQLLVNDWENWGDLRLDLPDARIHMLGDVAWLATTGTVNMELPQDDTYASYLESVRQALDDRESDPKVRLLEILRGGTNTLFEAERGDEYTWPIRFTAVLVRRGGEWLIHQAQFSFATTRFPDVRNI